MQALDNSMRFNLSPQPSRSIRFRSMMMVLVAMIFSWLATSAQADWLVTLEGQLIETQGEWAIEGQEVVYTDLEGERKTLKLTEVDLEGSAETTALRTGKPYVAPVVPQKNPALSKTAQDSGAAQQAQVEEPKVVLYATSWCGYCRKARKLLKDLDVDFKEEDIERNRKAAVEMRRKVGGQSGVPVLDIGGTIVRGYNPKAIERALVKMEKTVDKEKS